MSTLIIEKAAVNDCNDIAILVGELLNEIMSEIGTKAFNFDQEATTSRLKDFVDREKYFVFVARKSSGEILGFISLAESYALYAEGVFGTIPELYVRPEYRSNQVGYQLVSQAISFAKSRSWKRLEVTTPPLPQFDKTLAFYEREGFAIAGGRKLKKTL